MERGNRSKGSECGKILSCNRVIAKANLARKSEIRGSKGGGPAKKTFATIPFGAF